MSDSGLRRAQYGQSGQATHDRVRAAEQAAMTPRRKKKKKQGLREVPTAPAYSPPQRFVDQRTADIEAARQADIDELKRRGLWK
jgi:hypothetical protein